MGNYDEIILDKAVNIAAKNGWDGDIERSGYAPLVFNHDFNRHLWGDKLIRATIVNVSETKELPAWQIHLMLMAIAPDPLQYLSVNLP